MAKAILMKGGSGGVTSSDVTASKAQVLQGYRTITSDSNDEVAEGEIENRGNIVDTVSFENAYWDLKFLARMEQGFYSQNEQWKPCVAIPYEVLAQTIGVDRSKMLDTLTIAGVQGTVPRWVCSSGDVLTAYNNAGFVWDDSYAGRGRGIIVGIKNGSCIQNANWVFLPSPNLYPQNVAKNVNINGVTGTRDYIDLINPTWLSDATLNLHVNTVEKEIHIPNKFPQYNGLFLKVIIWGSILDGYYKDSNGGACPCVLAVTNWDGGANFTIKVGASMFYGTLERQGSGFNDFRLRYRGSFAFNLSLNFLITEGFSHQWAGNYAT